VRLRGRALRVALKAGSPAPCAAASEQGGARQQAARSHASGAPGPSGGTSASRPSWRSAAPRQGCAGVSSPAMVGRQGMGSLRHTIQTATGPGGRANSVSQRQRGAAYTLSKAQVQRRAASSPPRAAMRLQIRSGASAVVSGWPDPAPFRRLNVCSHPVARNGRSGHAWSMGVCGPVGVSPDGARSPAGLPTPAAATGS